MLKTHEIISLVQGELEQAKVAFAEVQSNFGKAIDYYLGNKPLPPSEARSKVVSTDVADCVEWILPQIIESLTSHGSPVLFDPLTPKDAMQSDLETDFTHHVFMSENEGFLALTTAVKDALLHKNGIFKIWYDETPTYEQENYSGLSSVQIEMLEADPDLEIEKLVIIQEAEIDGTGIELSPAVFDVEAQRVTSRGRVRVEVIPPEDFLVNPDHDSTDLTHARFASHRTTKTYSDLLAEGYTKSQLKNAKEATTDADDRFTKQGEFNTQWNSGDESQKLIEVCECVMQIDLEGSGMAKLCKVVALCDEDDVYDVLEAEPIECTPFVSFSTIMMPHKFYGLSIYDRLREIQDSKTSLWRNMLDNVYLQNNREKEVVEGQVNIDDLLVSRAGGIKRVKQPNMIRELQVQPIGADGFNMLQYLDSIKTGRSGVSPDTQGQDLPVGNETAHGVERLMTAKEKLTGLMIRMVAETGLKPLYRKIRDLLVKHQDSETMFLFRDQWVNVNPTQWGSRSRMTVKVGTGTGDESKKLQALTQIIQLQTQALQMPAQAMVDDAEIYTALDHWCDAAGLNGALGYFLDPNSPEGQQKKQAKAQQSAQQAQIDQQMQAEMAKAQQQLSQAEMMKGQAAMQAQQVKMESTLREQELKAQITRLQEQLDKLKHDQDLEFKYTELTAKTALETTKLELQASEDLGDQVSQNMGVVNGQ